MLQYERKKTQRLNGVGRRRGGTCEANVGTRCASLIVLTFAETSSWRQKLFVRSTKVHTKSSCE